MQLARLALTLAAAAPLAAQNALQHHSANGFATRGTNGASAKSLLQRLPLDQACGRTFLADVVVALQDQSAATPESFTIEIRGDNPLAPGSPDMTAAGLLGSVGPITIQFPGSGPSALSVTVPLHIAIPPFIVGVPAGDIYIGIALPAAPLWPADGLSVQANGSPFEPMNPLAIGYAGAIGAAGLGWESAPGGPPALAPGNPTFDLRSRFADDTLQPFALLPGPSAQPNFGYAGIFPDLALGQQIGWRALATVGPGALAALFIGTSTGVALPAPLPVSKGFLCLLPAPLVTVGVAKYHSVPNEPRGTMAAIWGPFALSPALAGITLHAQAVSIGSHGQFVLTTSCRTQL
jgi:hypothetical protein